MRTRYGPFGQAIQVNRTIGGNTAKPSFWRSLSSFRTKSTVVRIHLMSKCRADAGGDSKKG